jgi:DNA-directed RNA polymerase subunit F
MKRADKLKDSIMMPPPRARAKSHSDTSEELRKNLIETITNISENSALQDELQRYFKEFEEPDPKKAEEDYTESICSKEGNEKQTSFNTSICLSCQGFIKSPAYGYNNYSNPNSFNFNLVNYSYNGSNDDDIMDNSLERLKQNLTGDKNKLKHFKQFKKLPVPNDKREIKAFIENILTYVNQHEFDGSLVILKVKLQTRYNDYKNKALNVEYFKECLNKMQNELISRICMLADEQAIGSGIN